MSVSSYWSRDSNENLHKYVESVLNTLDLSSVDIDQLRQLMCVTSDGDLVSKKSTKVLADLGFSSRKGGWSAITCEGVLYLEKLGAIHV